MISVISPIYNEADNLIELYKRVVASLESVHEKFEFILVENGSSDSSLEIIKDLRAKDPRIKFISLSRNFGHQGGILAGMTYASGDAVVSIDGDLQQPPELIPKMIELWKKGYDVVFTTKKLKNNDRNWQFLWNRIFYKLIGLISDLNLTYGQSDYRLLDRKVVDVILNIPEKHKFLRGMVEWVGFSQIGVEYEISPRKSGQSKFSFRNYVNFAFDGIFSFSTFPLRVFLWLGVSIATFCGFYAGYYFVMGLITLFIPGKNLLPPGSATITISILFLGGVQLIGIGCLGEYIGRIYSQTKERPDFIVKEKDL
ncbi:MAG TPA: glycosyltransferase family 2 protein [Candidatus Wujingus californicus]|uniref:glycosyltransferase family 2 protein n=1 Tax=Candidatus Wujingus californicus TaxID=3367618 RepID=UPI001DBDAF7A|nr:glycosyltransferase family 2 protein [Planctomycetota bacterium]